ncbi:MAG: PAS domain S-box protein, partial [Candidatus Obscuribacterales bacterium]|nr:PAS domain S-box protein [Candidatus Obscuribacterales bacterium]
DDAVEGRNLQLNCLRAQAAVTSRMREIADATANGFGMETLKSVMRSHQKLVKELDVVFGLLRKRYQDLDEGLPESWKHMTRLREIENIVLYCGLASTLAVAGLSIWYYRRQFLLRIRQMENNVESLTRGASINNPIAGNDEITHLDASFRNMSMQLAAVAERERALFENSSDMICVLDSEFSFIRANKASTILCGKSVEELISSPVTSIVAENSRDSVTNNLKAARASGAPGQCEVVLKSSNNKELITVWSIFWSPDKKSCHCVIHDVSDERALDKMRESFLRLIAGDFRAPLTETAALVDRLASGDCGSLPETATKKLSGATGTLARMVNLVDELIQLETLKSSSLNLNLKNQKVKAVLAESVKDTESLASRQKVNVEIFCPEGLSFTADFDRIVRVVTNFLSNALKFSPEGSTVKLVAEKTAAGKVQISVKDQGRGISKEQIGNLFQAFKQVTAADGKRGKGTGLGLVVCKRIVEEHGGSVGVESEEGKGSRFWLQIPEQSQMPQRKMQPTAELSILSPRSTAGSSATAETAVIQENESVDALAVRNANQLQNISRSIIKTGFPLGFRASKKNFWENLTFKQKGILLLGLPLLFQGVFMAAMAYFINESGQSHDKQMHNRFLTRNAIRTTTPLFEMMINLRSRDPNKINVKTCKETMQSASKLMNHLKDTLNGDKLATDYYYQLVQYTRNSLVPLLNQLALQLKTDGSLDEVDNRRYANMMLLMLNGMCAHVQVMVDAIEARDKDAPAHLQQIRQYETSVLLAGLFLNAATAVWLAIYFSSDVVRRLLVLSDNSQRLAIGAKLNEELSGKDEIAHLDRVFHETAKRLAEARAAESTFLDNANNIICAFDSDSRFVTINHAASDKLAIPFEHFDEYSLSNLLSEDEKESFSKALQAQKAKSEPLVFECKIKAGEKQIDTVWSILWSESEELFFAVAYDITARRELDRMKREFLALVTHDLRTPLSTIQGMAILLENKAMGELPEEALAALKEIKEKTKQILDLVNDLLDLSKLEAGEMKCEFNNVSMAELMDKLQNIFTQAGLSVASNGSSPEQLSKANLEADLERLAYAVSGMAMELFNDKKVQLFLKADCADSQLKIILSGPVKETSEGGFAGINSEDAGGQYNADSSHRLRLPLSKKLLQMHHAKASADKSLEQTSLQIILKG